MLPKETAAGQLSPADVAVLATLRSRLMPLCRQVEILQNELRHPGTMYDWPTIQRNTTSLTNLINSIQSLMNDDPETTKLLRSMHPYPVSPFPSEDPGMAAISDVLLRKKVDVGEENWITARLQKAQDFAHVPVEWGIEQRRMEKNGADEDIAHPDISIKDEMDIDAQKTDSSREAAGAKRRLGSLSEDQLVDVWREGFEVVYKLINPDASDDGSQPPSDGDSTKDEAMPDANGQDASQTKIIVAPPMMPLNVLHKFMATGKVDLPQA